MILSDSLTFPGNYLSHHSFHSLTSFRALLNFLYLILFSMPHHRSKSETMKDLSNANDMYLSQLYEMEDTSSLIRCRCQVQQVVKLSFLVQCGRCQQQVHGGEGRCMRCGTEAEDAVMVAKARYE